MIPEGAGGAPGRLLDGVKGEHVRQGLASFTDQALLSATNFVTGVLLARYTVPSVYGAFALAFGVLLALQGLQMALITGPLTVLGAPREGEDLRRFASALALAQVVLGLAGSLFCLLAAAVGRGLAASSEVIAVFLGLGVACLFVQLQEFFRRLLYSRLLPGRALVNDTVYCTLQLAGVVALWLLDRRGSGPAAGWLCGRNVFLAMAVSALAGTFTGFVQTRAFLLSRPPSDLVSQLKEAWRMGKFGLGQQAGNAMFHLANRLAAAMVAGTPGVAMLEAPRLLVAPLNIVGISAGSLTTPHAARAYAAGGKPALLGFLKPVAIAWAVGFGAYTGLIAAAPSFWLHTFYGAKYAGAETIVVLWCLSYFLLGLRVLPGSSLSVTRNYDVTMWAGLTGGAAVIAASMLLAAWKGVTGAALGRLVGDAVLLAVLVVGFIVRVAPRDAGRLRSP